MFAAISALTLLALVRAQTTASGTDIAAIEAHMTQSGIVPNLIATFNPIGLLNVDYSGTQITPGQALSNETTATFPTLSFTPGSDVNATDLATMQFTVGLVDANIVGTDEASTPQYRHWFVNGATVSGDAAPYAVAYTSATTVTDYVGPAPNAGTGPHRYVFVMYEQPSTFTAPQGVSGFGTFQLADYVSSSGLGDLAAANYITVENGDATVSIPATTAVDSATLSAASASASSSASGSSASASSMSGSMSSSGLAASASSVRSGVASSTSGAAASASSVAASATPSNGAASHVKGEFGVGMIVGVVGVVGCLVGAGLGF